MCEEKAKLFFAASPKERFFALERHGGRREIVLTARDSSLQAAEVLYQSTSPPPHLSIPSSNQLAHFFTILVHLLLPTVEGGVGNLSPTVVVGESMPCTIGEVLNQFMPLVTCHALPEHIEGGGEARTSLVSLRTRICRLQNFSAML